MITNLQMIEAVQTMQMAHKQYQQIQRETAQMSARFGRQNGYLVALDPIRAKLLAERQMALPVAQPDGA